VTRAVRGVISRRSILNEIDQINVPTLVIGADQDRATPPQHSRDIAARIASAQLVMLTDSGHTTPAEQPTALAAAVGGFLTRLKGDR
jgi:pimeloyl-ACP methyl ester carboxylesterase